MRIRLLSVLVASVLAAPAVMVAAAPAAAQATQAYRSPSGYTADLPADWERLPDSALDLGGDLGEGVVVEAAYTVAGGDGPSLAMIGRLDVGAAMTVEQFRSEVAGPNAQDDIQAGMDETDTGLRVGVPRWDTENQAVWVRMDAGPGTDEPAFGWSILALHPSHRSSVMVVYFGAPGADEAAARAAMKSIVRSLRAN